MNLFYQILSIKMLNTGFDGSMEISNLDIINFITLTQMKNL